LIWIDPAEVYYSPRRAQERIETLNTARRLRETLGHPLSIGDPYAGVGPALIPLIHEEGLIADVLASDLNPAAVELLLLNLAAAGLESIPNQPGKVISNRTPGSHRIGIADARQLVVDQIGIASLDLLLVNLPHDSIEHLPDILPLLRSGGPVVVRGWVIVGNEERQIAESRLNAILRTRFQILESNGLEYVRAYSAHDSLCRFEVWLQD
jgi:tRNA G37 N-methylase Trm5